MKNNLPNVFFDKYFQLSDRKITVTLKNGESYTGYIIGFFYEDDITDEPAIYKWHIVEEKEDIPIGEDIFGFLKGKIIHQKDVSEIFIFCDNSTIHF